MKINFTGQRNSILLDVTGQGPAEQALLTHLQEDHVAILCSGGFDREGVRIFIRNKADFEFRAENEDGLGRKGILERRRRNRKSRNRK